MVSEQWVPSVAREVREILREAGGVRDRGRDCN